MKRLGLLSIVIAVMYWNCGTAPGGHAGSSALFQITVSNDGLDSVKQFGVDVDLLATSTAFEIRDDATVIPVQLEDRNSNDIPDKMYFQVDLAPGAYKVLTAEPTDGFTQASSQGVQVITRGTDGASIEQFSFTGANPFALGGVIIENDFIAYRSVLNAPFGFDIIGKNTAALLLDTVQAPLSPLARWGGDILDEGSGLGVGGPALYDQSEIIRFNTFDERSYEVIADGPLRAEVHIRILGIPVRDEKVDILLKWQMTAGQHWAQVDMELINPTDLNLQMAFGLPRHPEASDFTQGKNGGTHFGYTYGLQSADGDQLGMALLVHDKYEVDHYREDEQDFFYLATPIDGAVQYRFLAAWVGGRRLIFEESQFIGFVRHYAMAYDQPPSVQVQWAQH